ncbi:MAG: DUF222 domain-containing protein, partial [Acidimicrobiales bacterium]
CRLPVATARARVRLGRTLRHMDTAEAVWLAGAVGEAQVGLLARAHRPATAEALARDGQFLVGEAARLRFASFARIMAYWVMRADPDGADADGAAQRESRRLHLSKSLGGMWFADGVFDPVTGAIIATELTRLEDELFRTDWAEAKARVGDGVGVADLARTPAQRRADALADMARRSAAADGNGRRPEPLFTVLVGYETFAGMLCLFPGVPTVAGSWAVWSGKWTGGHSGGGRSGLTASRATSLHSVSSTRRPLLARRAPPGAASIVCWRPTRAWSRSPGRPTSWPSSRWLFRPGRAMRGRGVPSSSSAKPTT